MSANNEQAENNQTLEEEKAEADKKSPV